MSRLTIGRVRRMARKPPAYVLRRIGGELRQELHQLQLRACLSGVGPLTPNRIVPGGLAGAALQTAQRAPGLGAFTDAIQLARTDSQAREQVRRRGAVALERRAELFGEEPVPVGIPPAWSTDPHTGREWPTGFHRRLDVFDLGRPTDVKLVWELSRLRHCLALAQAVAVLDDDHALEQLAIDLGDWRAHNPLGWTVNWTVGMEVGLRAVNMICIDGVLLAAGRELAARDAHVASLYQHGWFLMRNLEIGDINGNHYLANAVGLLWLGSYFGPVGEAERWLALGLRMTQQAAREQILEDGLDHEGSLPYHVLVIEMFLLALVAAGERLSSIRPQLRRMLDAAVAFTDERGWVPDLGDDDGGRVAAFADSPSRDARRVLALGAALLQHPGAARASAGGADEDAIWLAGQQRLNKARALKDLPVADSPVHFKSAGLVVMRTSHCDRVVLDVGPVGFRGRGGHGHLDALSLQAWLGGEVAIRDSGTATYTGDPALRNELRGVKAHTVVIVDGQPYARLGGTDGLWAIDGDSPPQLVKLAVEQGRQVAVARQELPCARGNAMAERTVILASGELRIEDAVDAPQGSSVCHVLQLPSTCELSDGAIVHPALAYAGTWPHGATLDLRACICSTGYGQRGEGKRAILSYVSPGERTQVSWSITTSSACAPS